MNVTSLALLVLPFTSGERPFPLVPTATGLTFDAATVVELEARNEVTWRSVTLPDGSRVSIDAERVRVDATPFVDGIAAHDLLEGAACSVWRGRVVGSADSEVALGFSLVGCHGWIRVGDDLWHLVGRPGVGGDWTEQHLEFVNDVELLAAGMQIPGCAKDALATPTRDLFATPRSASSSVGLTPTYEATIALECDYEYYTVFGSAPAAAAYATMLFSWVSALFEDEVGVVLTIPYLNVWTTPADPWSAGTGANENCIDRIYEFQAAWAGNVPGGADIAHMLSGANLGCGVAFIDGLCDPTRNFSVSGNQNGQTPFPVTPNDANLDFYLVSHELGHNFGAIHTHDYCPPIDECAPAGYFGQCQTQQQCSHPGTLMSYCHGCGGFSNIATTFHPQSRIDMRAHVETSACLPEWCPPSVTYCAASPHTSGCVPTVWTAGAPTLTGTDDFHVMATGVGTGLNGLLFYGFEEGSIPIAAGVICIEPPLIRVGVLNSGGLLPCAGRFEYHWTQSFFAGQAITVGETVHAQFWYRDAGSPTAPP